MQFVLYIASCLIALTYDTRLSLQSIANRIAIAKKLVTSSNAKTTSKIHGYFTVEVQLQPELKLQR